MRDSLLSRFQGTLAGVSLSHRLASTGRKKPIAPLASSQREADQKLKVLLNLNQYQWKWCELEVNHQSSPAVNEEILMAQMTRSLIRCQGLEQVDWEQSWQDWQRQDWKRRESKQSRSEDQSFSPKGCSWTEAITVAVPIALFFHDQPEQIRQQLQAVFCQNPSPSSVLEEAIFAVSYGISLALTKDFNPCQLIPQILHPLDPQFNLHQKLQHAQILTEQRVSLETVREQLFNSSRDPEQEHTAAIAFAFYCFVSTPQEPAIALLRAVQMGCQSSISSKITGALSGAYHGFSGFPLSWQHQLKKTTLSSPKNSSAEPQIREKFWVVDSLKLATELFSVWSGVYNTANSLFETKPTPVVIAPNRIHSSLL